MALTPNITTVALGADDTLGVISDLHSNVEATKAVLAKHPEIKHWLCLGDVVDQFLLHSNQAMINYWRPLNIPTLLGNHDYLVGKAFRLAFDDSFWLSARPTEAEILFGGVTKFLAYHSLPADPVTFVNKTFTEREFIDAYPISDDILGVLIGHNHEVFNLEFPYTSTQLHSIGSVGKQGAYALLTAAGCTNLTLK